MKLPVALIGLLLIAPTASAQVDDFSLTVGSVAEYISPTNSTDVTVTVEVGCGLILQGAGESTVDVAVTGGDGYVSSSGTSIEVDPTDCVAGGGIVSGNGTVALEPVDGAMGLEPFDLGFNASLGDASDNGAKEGIKLDYQPGHAMDPAGDQTFDVTNGTITFPLEVRILANARTMVMFEQISTSAGSVGGFSSTVFDVPNGVRGDTFQVTWNAPAGEWTEATVSFNTYSHCLDKDPCPEVDPADVTWTFVNAGDAGGNSTNDDDGKESPGLPLVGAVVAIAFVALARRRS